MTKKFFRISCALVFLVMCPRAEGTWNDVFSYPFQWIREAFSSQSSAEFSRRVGELLEQNVTFLNDSRIEMQLWPNLSVTVHLEDEKVPLNQTNFVLKMQENSSIPVSQVVDNQTDSMEPYENDTDIIVEEEDNWKDYFEQLLTQDTAFCFSLLVCEISARPDDFLEYGRRVARFFETYRPSSSNSAALWYVNAAELGRNRRSLSECRANYPFCFVDTRQLVALLDVPTHNAG